MLIPQEEPLEPGKKRVKVPKKKTPGKKVSPKKEPSAPKPAVKQDLLAGIEYELTEVEGADRVTEKQTHLLVIKKGDNSFKYALYEKPDERTIRMHYEAAE
jgi:hypothetical protein